MRIIFSNLKEGSHLTDYLEKNLNDFNEFIRGSESPISNEDIVHYVEDIKKIEEQEKTLTDHERKALHIMVDGAKNFISKNFPLEEGEKLISINYSYLTKELDEIPAHTPVFSKQTDMGVTWFVFDHLRWTGNRLEQKESKIIENIYIPEEVDTMAPSVISIIGEIGIAIVKGFAGKMGSTIFDKLFNSDVNFSDKMYKELTKLVKEELTIVELDKIEGYFKKTGILMYTDYYPKIECKNPATKEERIEWLSKKLDILDGNLSILALERWKKPGIIAYMANTSLIIRLLQEMAYSDPNCTNPSDSSYAETIRRRAKEYKEYVKIFSDKIIDERKKCFKCYPSVQLVYKSYSQYTTYYYYDWKDTFTNDSKRYDVQKCPKNNEKEVGKECEANMNAHMAKVISKLDQDYKFSEFISNMEHLEKRPIPES